MAALRPHPDVHGKSPTLKAAIRSANTSEARNWVEADVATELTGNCNY
jgi:hypothetical protein